jgi:hypothetical protein
MINVVCLKHGSKYSAQYVNTLYNMISRHLTLPYEFYCFTENPAGLDSRIKIKELPKNSQLIGWWWKPYLFKKGHFPDGDDILFFDLDMVIVNNIDNIAQHSPGNFSGLRDVGRVWRRYPEKLGSAVMKWPANQYCDIWDKIEQDPKCIARFFGDQDWIWHCYKDFIKFFPDQWIRSYKWEVRTKEELIRTDGKYVFKDIKNISVDKETSVLAFHGTPNPVDVKDPIIVDNWQ